MGAPAILTAFAVHMFEAADHLNVPAHVFERFQGGIQRKSLRRRRGFAATTRKGVIR